jgi:hypothetical protein
MLHPSPVSRLRVLVALLLSLLVVGESAGVARAMGAGSMIRCCCGAHAVARACNCLHCPVKLRRAHAHDHAEPQLAARGACVPLGEEGVLVVVATLAPAPALAVPRRAAPLAAAPPRTLHDRVTEPARPPP